ncbi:MAG: ribosome recycling factor [Limnochordia bacterium]|jgi:ribosome recycling factor|nr:ribosome recycling factor [Limnochordia bacterium]MDD2628949.1 ribosome recycling factor [Limnochordia bacterium]MDD2756128.1 ribosome recycling factor [Methanothrix sp.]MDD4516919.1 ribosome recycling factor [Limnochordia bacterium]
MDSILSETREKMDGVIEALKREFASVRTGRANPSLLDRMMVDYYDVPTPLRQIANVSAPEPQLLVVQPYDKTSISGIEKAILKSDLGLVPSSDGNVIRLAIPPLTEERRKDLAKLVAKEAEDKRVAVRHIRRDANSQIKAAEKDGDLPEDESRKMQDDVQKLTDEYIEKVDELLSKKQQELMEV